ncbi:MAG: glycosyltransferase family 4 protein [Methanomassiliicoccales archaeon]
MNQKIKVLFIPKVEKKGITSERTPKMMELLSRSFEVKGLPMDRLDAFVFNQSYNKPARYLLFPMDVAHIACMVIRELRREKYNVIFAEGSYYSLAASLAAWLTRTPLIWDNHGNIVTFSKIQGKSRIFTWGNLIFERRLQRLCSKILVVNQRDMEDYVDLGFERSKLEVVPTCADMIMVRKGIRKREQARSILGIPNGEVLVLFVGMLTYAPNAEAVQYLASILPEIRKDFPHLNLYVAGAGPPPITPPEGMHFLGFVPDLYIWLSASDICVAPIWRGVGILTKVIDYLSAGKASVVTPLALDGIPELKDGVNCLIGQDYEDFKRKLRLLVQDEMLRERLANEGKGLIENLYSCEVVFQALQEIVLDLAAQ